MPIRLIARLAVLGIAVGSFVSANAGTPEYAVKAAYVYNFVKFVDWPQGDSLKSLTVCIGGRSPIGGFLEEAVKGKLVHGLPVEVKRMSEIDRNWDSCQVLFFGAASRTTVDTALNQLKGRSILTIGESATFTASGGMIALLMENDRARFEINLEAAVAAGLKVSSKLLELGHVVGGRK